MPKSYDISCVLEPPNQGQKVHSPDTEGRKGKMLPVSSRIGYSLGHVFNDLCASVWFSYSLLFFKLEFKSSMAGGLVLLGQVADALATPFVGYKSDTSTSRLFQYLGKRKGWHVLGTLLVTLSFPFIYNQCLGCQVSEDWVQFIYYGAFIVVFQLGWASVQVSHVSLITDLTPNTEGRVELNAYRQAATVAANVFVYGVTFALLKTGANQGNGIIGREDSSIFGYVALICCSLGIVFTLIFYALVKETNSTLSKSDLIDSNKGTYRRNLDILPQTPFGYNQKLEFAAPCDSRSRSLSNLSADEVFEQRKWSHWLRKGTFWKVGLIYMMARLYFNLSQVYTPLYLQYTLAMNKDSIAIIPFITYSTGFVFSFVTRPLSAKAGSKAVLLVGCAFAVVSCLWIQFGDKDFGHSWQVYTAMALNGIGSTGILIGSLAITADLIGSHTETGAFVFGAMSFLDKMINGAAVFLLEHFMPPTDAGDSGLIAGPPNTYYKHILVFFAGGGVMFTLLGLLSIRSNPNLGEQKRNLTEPPKIVA